MNPLGWMVTETVNGACRPGMIGNPCTPGVRPGVSINRRCPRIAGLARLSAIHARARLAADAATHLAGERIVARTATELALLRRGLGDRRRAAGARWRQIARQTSKILAVAQGDRVIVMYEAANLTPSATRSRGSWSARRDEIEYRVPARRAGVAPVPLRRS